ncbi:DNA helicase [Candidatus Poribacteria bacterium]|nr:MAG: DNA helicase [Candidatus Poribacteria bacterium]
MTTLNLKPTHKPVKAYYESLQRFESIGVSHETAVRSAFQTLLEYCGRQFDWILVPEHSMTPLIRGVKNKRIVVDGALIDTFQLPHGYWEAKDIHDDLPTEVLRKFEKGYPRDNILFQTPHRALLWQNNQSTLDADLTDPTQLIHTLEAFFSHRPQEYTEWEEAVAQFKDRVPALGNGLAELIEKERGANREFTAAFAAFHEKCRQSINPNLSEAAVEEMLIQHLLTERIFRTVFSNSEFTRRNVIAREIETVITALMSHAFSREDFLRSLDPFYVAIERTAATIDDFSQKQGFLNTVYEQFFQGFSVEVADTHGVVYTPQPIVDFMVRSVEEILGFEFNRSLSDSGVHIIDPFVGTGNFIVRTMREIRPTALEDKYRSELHCNEVMLLPYYIASMNIEHEFYEATGDYQPFEGICLVDTFELAEDRQLPLFAPDNTRRVETQKETPMFVVIGNPPYNVGQINENDNNKNRKYPTMDARVADTYAKDSKATLKSKLSDPYVKAIRWASDRLRAEGVVAVVTNNSFLDNVAFDGMRKLLADNFDVIYILDLSGNVRKNPKLSGTTHNVFGIQVGVSINFFIKKRDNANSQAEIFYARVDEFWRKEDKYRYLDSNQHYRNIKWKSITPGHQYTWLTEGLRAEFETFIPMGTKEAKAAKGKAVEVIFKSYSLGVSTNRDVWVYNFNRNILADNVNRLIGTYSAEVDRWKRRENRDANVDDFVTYDDTKISWSRDLKTKLKRERTVKYADHKVRVSLYRPFTQSNLYFDRMMNDVVSVFPSIFPTPETEHENRVIVVPSIGGRSDYWCFCTDIIPNLTITSIDGSQCFPFYTYDEDGTNRRENITDWALARFRAHYRDEAITKWDIFHHVYALLHHPVYRERYQANLKRDLPRLLYTPDFWDFAKAGQRLGEIHVGYEEVPEYQQLTFVENREVPINWRVEKMKLSKDKTQVMYNDFLTLEGIPAKAFDYRLGNRSALEWVIDQYRVKTDKRSGIINDPNRADDPRYIVKLIGKVIAVSLGTVEIVEKLPDLGVPAN